MYLSNYEQFQSTAKFWTDCYAKPKEEGAQGEGEDPAGEMYSQIHTCAHVYLFKNIYVNLSFPYMLNEVTRLMDMGFPKDKCINALKDAGGDENTAVAMLCSEL